MDGVGVGNWREVSGGVRWKRELIFGKRVEVNFNDPHVFTSLLSSIPQHVYFTSPIFPISSIVCFEVDFPVFIRYEAVCCSGSQQTLFSYQICFSFWIVFDQKKYLKSFCFSSQVQLFILIIFFVDVILDAIFTVATFSFQALAVAVVCALELPLPAALKFCSQSLSFAAPLSIFHFTFFTYPISLIFPSFVS